MSDQSVRDTETFLERRQAGLGKLLGVTFPVADRRRVVAQLTLEPAHVLPDGIIESSVVAVLADCANGRGAALDRPAGLAARTIESKTQFLGTGTGSLLRAEASPLSDGPSWSVWRAAVFHGDEQVAEVTQTQLISADPAAKTAASLPAARAGERERRGAGHFSQAVIDERWRQILDGASRVIAAKGFAKASIREIAAAAEMPVPTMYQYLERKEDILYNIYKYFMSDIVAALQRWREIDMPPRERLVGAIRTMIDVFDKNHRFIKLMFQETRALTPEARRQVYALDAQYIAIVRDLLTDGMQRGELRIRNVELAANIVYFLCTIWPLRFWTIGKYGEAAVSSEIVDFVLKGLAADPQPAPRRRKP